jgi:hypothetical protein
MSTYFPAFRMNDPKTGPWLFVRCSVCASIVAEVDKEMHDSWHEFMDEKIKIAGLPHE